MNEFDRAVRSRSIKHLKADMKIVVDMFLLISCLSIIAYFTIDTFQRLTVSFY